MTPGNVLRKIWPSRNANCSSASSSLSSSPVSSPTPPPSPPPSPDAASSSIPPRYLEIIDAVNIGAVPSLKGKVFWARPEHYYGPDFCVISSNPKETDVVQGSLRNCWFVTALTLLANRPEFLLKVIPSREMNERGYYEVRLFVDGKWVSEEVTDEMPCNEHGKLLFARAAKKQLWVPLIEKAMAKRCGSYAALEIWLCVEALVLVTGMPCGELPLPVEVLEQEERKNFIWESLLALHEANYLMTCGTRATLGIPDIEKEFRDVGLLPQHGYSLLEVRNYEEEDKLFRLLKLRNPWGRAEWMGDWSTTLKDMGNNTPDMWTPNRKHDLGFDDLGKGVFWISFLDFLHYFTTVEYVETRRDWLEPVALPFVFPEIEEETEEETEKAEEDEKSLIRNVMHAHPEITRPTAVLTVHERCELVLTVFQTNPRMQKRPMEDMMLLVFSADWFQCVGVIQSQSKGDTTHFIKSDLTTVNPGCYYIMVHSTAPYRLRKVPDCTFVVHAVKPVQLQAVGFQHAVLRNALLRLVQNDWKQRGENEMEHVKFYDDDTWVIVVAENNTSNYMQLDLDFRQCVNLKIDRWAPKPRKLTLAPQTQQIAALMFTEDVEYEHQYKSKITYRYDCVNRVIPYSLSNSIYEAVALDRNSEIGNFSSEFPYKLAFQ